MKVIGTATTDAGADAIGAALAAFAGCRGIRLNVTDGAAVDAAIDAIVKAEGGLHVLVNNAGITRDTLSMRMKDEDWDAVLDTNLKAVFRASRAAIRPMMKQRYGPHRQHHLGGRRERQRRAGQLRGGQGRRGRHDALAGARARQPQHHRQLRRAGLHRDRHDRGAARGAEGGAAGADTARPAGSVDEVAAAVEFLASPRAGYITGTELHVNGGMYMN